MMKRMLLLALPLLLVAAQGPARGETAAVPVVASDAAGRRGLDLTVYNQDLALVREARDLELPRGLARVEFRDVPARIDPTSLRVEGGKGFALLEQNYEFDLLSRDRILQKYVGRDLSWLQEDGATVTGTLLGVNDGPVFRVDGRIVFEVPGRIALPTLPEDLRDRPTLVWLVESDKARRSHLKASYLTGGLSWKADYVLDLDREGRLAALQAWVTVDNQSGASYAGATLRLVAGDVNRVTAQPPHKILQYAADAEMARTGRGFSEEGLYDYHLYTLGRPTDLKDRQIKQISLFEREGVPVERRYRLRPGTQARRSDGLLPVEVSYRFANDGSSGLDLPLPAGTFRVYGSSGGGRQLLGEDRIDHTPKGERVELTVGRAFDVVAERVVTETQRLGERGQRISVRVALRNHKDEDVTVEVGEPVWGEWQVTASSLPPRKVSAGEVAFDVPIKAGGETVLTYTVEMNR